MMDSSPNIDDLLKHYLTLLDKYSTLRSDLSRLQSATFHNLARANFAAERGLRFGPDSYDERMQALRIARITSETPDSGPTFHVVKQPAVVPEAEKAEPGLEETSSTTPQTGPPRDPIRWFGLLTPPALRQTQASAVEAVERVIPQLLTVEAEMRRVEIEVRRARKRRAKAEAAAAKGQEGPQAPLQEAVREEVAAS